MTNQIQGAIVTAYHSLKHDEAGWVTLSRLRQHLSHIPRTDLDTALTALFRDNWIALITEVNQRALANADRAAALHIAGDDKHLYRVTG